MKHLLHELTERGFIDRVTDEQLAERCGKEHLAVYCGFDPTAPSLHCGNLLPILMLTHFQRAGHRVFALVGGATGLIGDPSGKKDERQLKTREEVNENVEGIRGVLSRFLDFEGANPARIVNNFDWMGPITFLDFIRDVGKYVRITEMLARDSVKGRLEGGAGMSFTEFSYQLLQAYDYHHLHQTQGVNVQVGGSDQWGNITAGTDLIRRLGGGEVHGAVCPLLTTASGAKFGKSESGAIWLSADRTSPYQFYQYWVRTEDRDVVKFLKLFTFLPMEEIEELGRKMELEPEKRESQKKLAWEVTALVHGPAEADNAVRASEALFGGELTGLNERMLLEIFSEVPSFPIPSSKLSEGLTVVDVLVEGEMAKSRSDARRLVEGGGVYLNNSRIDKVDALVQSESLLDGGILVFRVGKKKYSLGRVA